MKGQVRIVNNYIVWMDVKIHEPPKDRGILITDGKTVVSAKCNSVEINKPRKKKMIFYNAYGTRGFQWDWAFDTDDITHWSELPKLPNGMHEEYC